MDAFEKRGERRPLMVSVTMETTGTMLVGSDIAAVVAIFEPFPDRHSGAQLRHRPRANERAHPLLVGMLPFVVSCIPNAGLPENVGGVAHYRLQPLELKMQLMHFVEDLGVQVIGGCCGTYPEHIKALAELSEELTPPCGPRVFNTMSVLFSNMSRRLRRSTGPRATTKTTHF